jgi:hypothetical protein
LYDNASNSASIMSYVATLVAVRDVCKLVVREITNWVCFFTVFTHVIVTCPTDAAPHTHTPMIVMLEFPFIGVDQPVFPEIIWWRA